MRTGCISHPANERLLIIREWQVEFCKGDRVAAALLSFFEYWHSIKLAINERREASLYQHHTESQLIEGIFGIGKKDTIRRAINFLESTKCITIHSNPDPSPKAKLDRKRFFLLHPEVLTQYIFERSTESRSPVIEKPVADDRKIGRLYKESKITNSKTTEEEYPPISPQQGDLSLEAGIEFEFSEEDELPEDSPEPEVVATPNSEDSREVPKPESTSQQERNSPDGTSFPGVEQFANSISTQDNDLPDHAIAHPAMLSPVQKTEDRFHRDRNYLLKLEKFAAVWNENKPDDWLHVKLDRGAFKTQLTTAMKRYEGTVEELEKELSEAIAYAKTTKEAQKPLTALDLCNYSFSKLAEWSAKWKARHQPKESAHPISSAIDSLDDDWMDDDWMDEVKRIFEENQ